MFSINAFLKDIIYRLRADYTTEKLIKMGLKVGKNFKRMHGTILDPSHCWLISIGDNVTMAPRVHVLAHDASTCPIVGHARIGRVNIGSNVFIGSESIILPGVSIGNDVVVGAGSVVTKDIPGNSVAVGNPARVIRTYEEYSNKVKNDFEHSAVFDESYTLRNKHLTSEMKNKMCDELKSSCGFVE